MIFSLSGSLPNLPRCQGSLISHGTCSPLSLLVLYTELCITVICGDFLSFLLGLGSSREGLMSFGPLCPLVSIPCTPETSVNTGGIRANCLQGGSVRPSARLDAEACPPEAGFLRQLCTCSVLQNACSADTGLRTGQSRSPCQSFLHPCPEPRAGPGFLCA